MLPSFGMARSGAFVPAQRSRPCAWFFRSVRRPARGILLCDPSLNSSVMTWRGDGEQSGRIRLISMPVSAPGTTTEDDSRIRRLEQENRCPR
jgi:hypothetical protein